MTTDKNGSSDDDHGLEILEEFDYDNDEDGPSYGFNFGGALSSLLGSKYLHRVK